MTSGQELLDDEKRFYERFNALVNDHQLMAVVERFGVKALRRSSVLEGFEKFVIASGFSGRCCVEIGTCKGLTAVVLARYFEEVVTIDTHPDPLKYEITNFLNVRNVRFVDVKDNAEKAAVVRATKFDAAYIDGDHTHDTELDFSLVRHCANVMFHEYWPVQQPVWNLVNSLRSSGSVATENKLARWTA